MPSSTCAASSAATRETATSAAAVFQLRTVHPAHPAHQVRLESRERPDLMARTDQLDCLDSTSSSLTTILKDASNAHLDHQDLMDFLDRKDSKECLARTEISVPQEKTESQELKESRETQDNQGTKDKQECPAPPERTASPEKECPVCPADQVLLDSVDSLVTRDQWASLEATVSPDHKDSQEKMDSTVWTAHRDRLAHKEISEETPNTAPARIGRDASRVVCCANTTTVNINHFVHFRNHLAVQHENKVVLAAHKASGCDERTRKLSEPLTTTDSLHSGAHLHTLTFTRLVSP